jgi:hypothetical protein
MFRRNVSTLFGIFKLLDMFVGLLCTGGINIVYYVFRWYLFIFRCFIVFELSCWDIIFLYIVVPRIVSARVLQVLVLQVAMDVPIATQVPIHLLPVPHLVPLAVRVDIPIMQHLIA